MAMEYLPLVSGLVGALIGSLSSIVTLLIQSHYQTKREMKKLAIEVALKDFIFRAENQSELIQVQPVALLINYYDRIIDLVNKEQLTPERLRELMYQNAKLGDMLQKVANDWDSAKGKPRSAAKD
jgi:hypothetical protein